MPLKTEILSNFSGGTNLVGQPLSMADNDLIECTNMYPVDSGYLVGRGGQENYNSALIDANPVKSLYRFYKQSGQGILLAHSGASLFRGDDVTGVFTSIDAGLSTLRTSFTTWTVKDKVYYANPATNPHSYDGTTVTALTAAPAASQIELYLDRLYLLIGNSVRFSDLSADNSWPGAAEMIISDNIGGTGQFLKAANNVLIAGKTSGLWRLEGSPLLGNVFRPYSDVGCLSGATADVVTIISNGTVAPIGVIFAGKDGIYITDGFQCRLVSKKIDPIFTGYFRSAVGKYYPRRRQYLFSFDTAGAANDTMWVGTNIDVSGSSVAWSEYTGFNADSFTVWDGGADNGELYMGSSLEGRVRKLDTGSQDNGTDFQCSFTTHYFGSPERNQQMRWMKPVFDATKPVHYQIDYFQKQQSVGSVTVDVPAGVWDVGTWDVGTWGGTSYNSARTSLLDYRYGRYYSTRVSNTGDGPLFKFFQLATETRLKDRRFNDVFSLNATP